MRGQAVVTLLAWLVLAPGAVFVLVAYGGAGDQIAFGLSRTAAAGVAALLTLVGVVLFIASGPGARR